MAGEQKKNQPMSTGGVSHDMTFSFYELEKP